MKLKFNGEKINGKGKYRNINCEYKINIINIEVKEKNMIFQDEDILNNKNYKQFEILYNKIGTIGFCESIITNTSKNNVTNSSSQYTLNYTVNTLEVAYPYEIIKL